MSWSSKKYRWLEATKRAFTRLEALRARARHGDPVSVLDLDDLVRQFAALGERAVHLHQGGGPRYQQAIETKGLQIEAAVRLLKDLAQKHGIHIVKPPKFIAPWTPKTEDGKTAGAALDELRADFGLHEEEEADGRREEVRPLPAVERRDWDEDPPDESGVLGSRLEEGPVSLVQGGDEGEDPERNA